MYLDLLLLILILSFGMLGFFQGFLHQLISIVILLAIFLGATPLSEWLRTSPATSWAHTTPQFVLWSFSAMALLLVGWTARWLASRYVQKGPLQAADRWIGFGLGLCKGVILAFVVGLFFQVLPSSVRESLAEIDRDMRDSKVVSASASLLNFESIPSIEVLRSWKSRWDRPTPKIYVQPWSFDDGIERD